jgi:hypothetical protein
MVRIGDRLGLEYPKTVNYRSFSDCFGLEIRKTGTYLSFSDRFGLKNRKKVTNPIGDLFSFHPNNFSISSLISVGDTVGA